VNGVHQAIRRAADLSRGQRAALVALVDTGACAATAVFAYWLRLGELFERPVTIFVAIAVPMWLTIALATRTYRSLVRFSGWEMVRQLANRCFLMSVGLAVVLVPLRIEGIPRTLAVLHPLVLLIVISGIRL